MWGQIAATVGSSLLQGAGASSARRRQEEAARQANAVLQAAQARGETLQQPYANAGSDAIQQLMARMPELTASYDPARIMREPGYQFGQQQGQRALEGSLAARGLTDSGAALKAAARYGTDYATTKFNDAFNRDRASRNDIFSMLTGTAGIGQRSAESMSGLGERTAAGVAGNITGAGNAGAASRMAQGNIAGDLLGQLGGMDFGGIGRAAPKMGAGWASQPGWGTGDAFGNQDYGQYLADGGAVRVEPRVGTRAPRRAGGGGGGMSRDAVLQALDVAWRDVPATPQPGTLAALPADPVRNPRAILDARERKAGAYAKGGPVRGKTPGKADKVPANLSGGEHVIDAEVVAMLGDGNTEAGHELLEELKRRVREFKRQAPAGQPAKAIRHAD